MGRRRQWFATTVAHLPTSDALKRLKAVLRPGESQARFIANAIMQRIERRERGAAKKQKSN
jgi:hypothetical protein